MSGSTLLVPALLGVAVVGAVVLTRGASRNVMSPSTPPSAAPRFDGVGRTARMLRRGTERT